MNPIIVRGIGGFYDVLTPDGQLIRCQLRGKLRLSHDKVLVGDWVQLAFLSAEQELSRGCFRRKTNWCAQPSPILIRR